MAIGQQDSEPIQTGFRIEPRGQRPAKDESKPKTRITNRVFAYLAAPVRWTGSMPFRTFVLLSI